MRGLAREIAAEYAGGATPRNVETARRALNKYLREGRRPSKPMRLAIARALGVDESEMPTDDPDTDAFRGLTRDPEVREALLVLGRALADRR